MGYLKAFLSPDYCILCLLCVFLISCGDTGTNTNPSVNDTLQVINLENDSMSKSSKTWIWSCNNTPCTYRHKINQSATPYSFDDSTDNFNSTATDTQDVRNGGEGTYYLHVQAKDSEDNKSEVLSVFAILNNLGNTIEITDIDNDLIPKKSKTWTWSCSKPPCVYRYSITTSPQHDFSENDLYVTTATAAQSTGDGIFYIHIQAKESEDSDVASEAVSFSAILDNTPPDAPNASSFSVSSPNNRGEPDVTVSSLTEGDRIEIYTSSDCSGSSVGDEVVGNSQTSVSVKLPQLTTEGSYKYYAKIIDVAGNTSSCSKEPVLTYVLDQTAPEVTGLEPDSVEKGAKTWLWSCNESCTYRHHINNEPQHTFKRDEAYTLTNSASQVEGQGTYYLHVQAKDIAGNESRLRSVSAVLVNKPGVLRLVSSKLPQKSVTWTWGCNKENCTYRHEINQNATPYSFDDNTDIFNNVATASQNTGDGTYYLHVQAKATQDGQELLSTVEVVSAILDNTPPSALALTHFSTQSPSNDRTPEITISDVTEGDTINLYRESRCTTSVGTATVLAGKTSVAIEVNELPNVDGSYDFYATVTDQAGNRSGCSTDKLTYVLDVIAPSSPSNVSLVTTSPSTDPRPYIKVDGIATGDIVSLFTDNRCSETNKIAFASAQSGSIDIQVSTPLTIASSDNQKTFSIYANTRDTVGNISSCSTTSTSYVLQKPAAPTALTLVAPTTNAKNLYVDATPTIRVGSVVSGQTVNIYTVAGCGSDSLSSMNASASGTVDVKLSRSLFPGTYKFYATISHGSNVSSCSSASGFEYVFYKPVAKGGFHTCFLFPDGRLKCWGYNLFGQLGLGDTSSRGDDEREMGSALGYINLGSGRTAKATSAGNSHTCAVLDNDKVKCWGTNSHGQLGLGNKVSTSTPGNSTVNLGTNLTAKAISVGNDHACAILDNDKVKCWGRNSHGQLGLGDTKDRGGATAEMGDALPYVEIGNQTAKAVSAGDSYTCVILNNDQVKCWGLNNYGQLGLRHTRVINQPQNQSISLGANRKAKAISAGSFHTCVILDENSLKCWGRNDSGQLGLETDTNSTSPPNNPVDLGTGRAVREVSTGFAHTCVVLDNDEMKCFGNNGHGQLGLGDTENLGDEAGEMGSALPAISLGSDTNNLTYKAKAVSIGSKAIHVCALLTTSKTNADAKHIKCWGDNNYGQLGLGDTQDRGDGTGDDVADTEIIDVD